MPFTEEDPQDIAWACRAMERQKTDNAKAIENPMVRGPLELAAKRYATLARRFETALRERKVPSNRR